MFAIISTHKHMRLSKRGVVIHCIFFSHNSFDCVLYRTHNSQSKESHTQNLTYGTMHGTHTQNHYYTCDTWNSLKLEKSIVG